MDEQKMLQNLEEIRTKINKAALKAGRNPSEIKLIAVSKNHPLEKIRFLQKQGLSVFGESRVQELREKYNQLEGIEWHFIGHLQRNKVKYLLRLPRCTLIHSLDSLSLAEEIDYRGRQNKRIMPVLLEVNVAKEENKFGISPEETLSFMQKLSHLQYIRVQGLMTIAPYCTDPEEVRPFFRKLYSLREAINKEGYKLTELSMGMSNDFEVAIEEGATMVRIGTKLLGQRGEN